MKSLQAQPEILAPDDRSVRVVACPHPFRTERVTEELPAGLSLSEILAHVQPDPVLGRFAAMAIDGQAIDPAIWDRVRPKPGTEVTVRVLPQGGEGKDPLRTVLTIAVLAAAIFVPGLIGLEAGTLGFALASAAIGVAGTLAVNALVPPTQPKVDSLSGRAGTSFFLSGSRNRALPFGVVPKVLGRHRMTPPLAARTFTETAGGKQFLRMLFCCGVGPVEIGEMKIGETPLEDFEGVEVEIRQGLPGDPASIDLFPDDMHEESYNVRLRQKDGWTLRTTQVDIDQISVDITFPGGLVEIDEETGGKLARRVDVRVEFSPADKNQWSIGETGQGFGVRTVALPAEPDDRLVSIRGQPGPSIIEVQQIHRVVMDPHGGSLEVLSGAPVAVAVVSGATPPAFEPGTPAAPPWPARKIRIAEVLRSSQEPTVTAARITDKRPTVTAARFPFGSSFGLDSDFAPAPSSPAGDSIELAAGTLIFSGFSVKAKKAKAIRRNFVFDVPVRGQYDVRLKRVTADSSGGLIRDKVVWTALRSIRNEPPVDLARNPELALIALRIQASDQLSGVVDQFNVVITSILPDWTGAAWVARPTRNPAALLRAALQDAANARPLANTRLDLPALEDFHEWCELKGFTFDQIVDFPATVFEIARDVAGAGRAALTVRDGLWGVAIDEPKSVPVQHFSPRNSFGFSGSKAFPELPHGFRVRFVDASADWQQGEVLVFDDGFDETNATKFETLELPGITAPELAKRHARYHLAVARLRPETFTFSADVEAIQCQRGDLIRLSHDVPLFGLASGRAKAVVLDGGGNATDATLDEPVTMEAGKSYTLRFRLADGTSVLGALVNTGGETATVTFSPAIPLPNVPAAGDLFLFGETGSESVELIVKAIEPGPDLTFRIVCVAAAPGVHTAEEVLPAFDPQVSEPPGTARPAVESIVSDGTVLLRDGDGRFRSRILVTVFRPSGVPETVAGVELAVREAQEGADEPDDWALLPTVPLETGEVSVESVEDGLAYELRLRYVFEGGTRGPWTQVFEHRVEGVTAPPPDVPDLRVAETRGGALLTWLYPNPPRDLDGFEVRHRPGTLAQWEGAEVLPDARVTANSADISAVPGTLRVFMVKARDVYGNESLDPATVIRGLGSALLDNVVVAADLADGNWPGQLTNGTLVSNELRATDDGGLYLANDDAPYLPNDGTQGRSDDLYLPLQYLEMTYTEAYLPPAAAAPARATIDIDGDFEGLELSYRADGGQAYLPEVGLPYVDGADDGDPYLPGPADFAPWPEGLQLTRQPYELRLAAAAGNIATAIRGLTVTLDVPDRLDRFNDQAVSQAGTRLEPSAPFRAITGIGVDIQHDGNGAVTFEKADIDLTKGPLIVLRDGAGAAVPGVIDAVVQGY